MYTANDVIDDFVREVWEKEVAPYNSDPEKFRLCVVKGSSRQESFSQGYPREVLLMMRDVLGHITFNFMQAITSSDEGMASQFRWDPQDNPGIIQYSTIDREDYIAIQVEDNGSGINPAGILFRARKAMIEIPSPIDPLGALDFVFGLRVSTKRQRSQTRGNGLYHCRSQVGRFGGSIGVIGTTYRKGNEPEGDLKTFGEHHGGSTGTIIEISLPYSRPTIAPGLLR